MNYKHTLCGILGMTATIVPLPATAVTVGAGVGDLLCPSGGIAQMCNVVTNLGGELAGAHCWADVLGTSHHLGEVLNPGDGPTYGPPASVADFKACGQCSALVNAFTETIPIADGAITYSVRVQPSDGHNGREITCD